MDFAFFSFCNYFNAGCSIHFSHRYEQIQISRKTNCLPLTLLFIYFYRVSVPPDFNNFQLKMIIHTKINLFDRKNEQKGLKHVFK